MLKRKNVTGAYLRFALQCFNFEKSNLKVDNLFISCELKNKILGHSRIG